MSVDPSTYKFLEDKRLKEEEITQETSEPSTEDKNNTDNQNPEEKKDDAGSNNLKKESKRSLIVNSFETFKLKQLNPLKYKYISFFIKMNSLF